MLSDLEEKTIRRRTIFDGKLIRVQLDEVELPDGRTSTREIVHHPGAVGVLAFTDEGKLVFVRQYRNPLGKTILEIPAGKLEPGEDPKACAFRELEEETGYRAEEMRPIVSLYTSPGFADEILHLYEARGLQKGEEATGYGRICGSGGADPPGGFCQDGGRTDMRRENGGGRVLLA